MRTWLGPNGVGVVLLLTALCIELCIRHSTMRTATSGSPPTSSWTLTTETVGWPTLYERIEHHDLLRRTVSSGVTLDWLGIAQVVTGGYLILMPLGRFAGGGWGRTENIPARHGWRRPTVTLLLVIAFAAAVGVGTGGVISKMYWGFAFTRPAVDRRVRDARGVQTYTHVSLFNDQSGPRKIPQSLPDEMDIERAKTSANGHYFLQERVADALRDRQLLRPTPATMPVEQLDSIPAIVVKTGRLDPSDAGNWRQMTVVEFSGPNDEPLLFVGGTSDSVANDHFAFYEFVFTNDSRHVLLSTNRFYYDSGGLEGWTWRNVALGVGVLTAAIAVPATLLWMVIRRFQEQQRFAPRGFAVEVS